jgi:hypothetical protein
LESQSKAITAPYRVSDALAAARIRTGSSATEGEMAEIGSMKFLLDTNVISELARIEVDRAVISWLDRTSEDSLFISVVTLAELHHGVERLPACTKRSRLQIWLSEALPDRFEGRVLPVDIAIARQWGIVAAQCEAGGHAMESMDALLAATAMVHKLILVTRNIRHFPIMGDAIVNPWQNAGG